MRSSIISIGKTLFGSSFILTSAFIVSSPLARISCGKFESAITIPPSRIIYSRFLLEIISCCLTVGLPNFPNLFSI